MDKPTSQVENRPERQFEKQSEYRYLAVLYIHTDYVAPSLGSGLSKKLKLNDIKAWYRKFVKDISDDDLEYIDHLDRGFKRDSAGNIVVFGDTISGAMRNIIPGVIISGFFTFSPECVRTESEHVNLKGSAGKKETLQNYEYIAPGCYSKNVIMSNTDLLSSDKAISWKFQVDGDVIEGKGFKLTLGAITRKGRGQVFLVLTKQI